MLDMHNHVLFGVDDGCQTIEESMTMIRKAISVGVTDLLMTPHYGPLRGYVASNETIETNLQQLQDLVEQEGIPIRLYLGREIDEVQAMDELLADGTVKTLNATKYVLVDFGMKKTDVDEAIYELVIKGYRPIVAHPERYNYIEDPAEFHRWKKTGALLQLNATSVYHPKNKQVKKHALYLLKHGLVDFIGSDGHRGEQNYDDFQKLMAKLPKKYPTNRLRHDDLLGGARHADV
jgi:protein-tyrosine phosphatase